MNDTSETAERVPANHGLGPANSRDSLRAGRFLPEALVVAALLFFATVLVIAFRSHWAGDDRGPLAEKGPGDVASFEKRGDAGDFPPPPPPAEFGEPTPSPPAASEQESHPLRQVTGQDWRDASEEEREAIARILARWLHATANAEQQRDFADHYLSQLDRLSQQTTTGTSPLWDWLPLIHAQLVAKED